MKMELGFKKPVARQIREGVKIEMCEVKLMNSKSEWNSAKRRREHWVRQEREQKQRETEK